MINKILGIGLWLLVAICAVRTAHDFYRYVDRTIHVTVDDAEANIAYSVATDGRYGFPASPTLVGVERLNGQFNYGPWYFYLGSAIVWLFGFSLTAIRAIHLWVILGVIVVGAKWFDGKPRAVAGAIFGFGILYAFEASQWPMARPDSIVTAFAIGLLIFAGLGFRYMHPVYWGGAALMAVCGAFTHLVAVSLMPAAFALFVLAAAVHLWTDRDADRVREVRNSALGFVAGGAAGLVMFYGSFGFDIATQLRFLAAYRSFTAYTDSYSTAIGNHLSYAFGYLSPTAQAAVWATLAAGWLIALLSLRDRGDEGDVARAAVLPPSMVWSGYLLSNGFYTNYHKGYAVLHQVMWLWLAAAVMWVVLRWIDRRWPRAGTLLVVAASVALLFHGWGQLQWQVSGSSPKLLHIDDWVPFSEYSSRVMASLPSRSTAWGSIVYGLESPNRIQLVQWVEGVSLMEKVAAERRPGLVPDFVVFGYSEARDNMLSALRGKVTLLQKSVDPIPDVRWRSVALVAGQPYGVSRVYARSEGDPAAMPDVSVYDAARQQWLSNLGPAFEVAFTDTAATPVTIGYEADPPPAMPHRTVVANLPPDQYLLRVAVTPGRGQVKRRLLAALSSTMLRQTIGEMGAAGDFAAYLESDREVFLLAAHPGGPLYVSQFDDGESPAIVSVEAFPIVSAQSLGGRKAARLSLPALGAWTAVPGVTPSAAGETLKVAGDATLNGYQLLSPPLPAMRGHQFVVQVPVEIERGKVCVGILNGDESKWLVPPDVARDDLRFVMDGTRKFRVAVSNCKSQPDGIASAFTVWPGSYVDESGGAAYADRLVAAALHPEIGETEPADLSVRTIPADLEVTKGQVAANVPPMAPADFGYVAAVASFAAGRWTVKGQAEGPYSYLLVTNPKPLAAADRVIVQGRVDTGGLTIGLLKDNQWAVQLAVLEPGDFTVVMAPPGRGSYAIVIANNLPKSLDTAIEITKFGVLSR